MDEEFLKKFVGKDIGIVPFGGLLDAGSRGRVASVDNAILRLEGDGNDVAYIDVDGIMAIIPCGEAIKNED